MRPSGQLGTVAMAAFGLVVLAIVGLLALDSWWTFGVAILLMLVGVMAMARFTQTLGGVGSRGEPREEVPMQADEASDGDELHSSLWELDLPLDHPAHHMGVSERPLAHV
jgi:hypothetical protein